VVGGRRTFGMLSDLALSISLCKSNDNEIIMVSIQCSLMEYQIRIKYMKFEILSIYKLKKTYLYFFSYF
jgi:hypothetical protein